LISESAYGSIFFVYYCDSCGKGGILTDKELQGRAEAQKTAEEYGPHIVQYSPEYSLCAGCETCSILCGLEHFGVTGPDTGCIEIGIGTVSMMHTVYACQQCADHPCYEACPKKGDAMKIDPDTGIVYINEPLCIGCGLCSRHCRFTPSRIHIRKNADRKKWKAVKCDLCRGRAEGPACIKWCPVRCIGLSDGAVEKDGGLFPVPTEEEVR